MKLNIVTAAANSVGQAILEKIANPEDITIWLSRKGCEILNVLNVKITDLTSKETTQKELLAVLSTLDVSKIDVVNLYHGCGFVVAEIPNHSSEFSHVSHPKVVFQNQHSLYDSDMDGIDDRTYHSLITTFKNVFSVVLPYFRDKKISIGEILSLMDKKIFSNTKTGEPTVFSSMVKANKILRAELQDIVATYPKVQGVIVSASTVRTATEDDFRKFSPDKQYRATCEMIANELVSEMNHHANVYKDIDVYVPHPEYNIKLKNETDEQMTDRLKREIGLI